MSQRNLHLSTDYPFDKVLATFQGSFNAPARYALYQGRLTNLSMNHDVGDYALPNGVYSFNGSVWYPFGMINAETSGSTISFQTFEVSAYCTATQVVIQALNYQASARTVHYALQLISRD